MRFIYNTLRENSRKTLPSNRSASSPAHAQQRQSAKITIYSPNCKRYVSVMGTNTGLSSIILGLNDGELELADFIIWWYIELLVRLSRLGIKLFGKGWSSLVDELHSRGLEVEVSCFKPTSFSTGLGTVKLVFFIPSRLLISTRLILGSIRGLPGFPHTFAGQGNCNSKWKFVSELDFFLLRELTLVLCWVFFWILNPGLQTFHGIIIPLITYIPKKFLLVQMLLLRFGICVISNFVREWFFRTGVLSIGCFHIGNFDDLDCTKTECLNNEISQIFKKFHEIHPLSEF